MYFTYAVACLLYGGDSDGQEIFTLKVTISWVCDVHVCVLSDMLPHNQVLSIFPYMFFV